ncbi:MAG: hypothetical protein QOJ99_518 [Bryobacterales bacterium]|nr:hypothetical protein [Bryobacterales bacterium]
MGNGKEDLTGPGAGCTFSGSYGEVTFTVQRPEQRLDIAAEVETLKASFAGATVREIAGLGTSAYLLEIGDSGAQVHVIRGEHDYLMVSVPGFGNAERVAEIAEALARKALARI